MKIDTEYLTNDVKTLQNIEQHEDVISIFSYEQRSTAWISIKQLLTEKMYDSNVRLNTGSKKDILSISGFKQVLSSLKHFMVNTKNKEKRNLFLGASTGLFFHEQKVKDTYFPYYENSPDNVIYMLNCGNLSELSKFENYTKNHNIVIENYLLVIIKKLYSKLLTKTIPNKKINKIKDFCLTLEKYGINAPYTLILHRYAEFVAGYKLYRWFFSKLNIDKAYIVSAPTKSDMVAALKSLDIKTIEIQHGVVGKLHRGYNFAFQQAPLIPTVDEIHVYNQFWKNEIIHAGYFHNEQIKVVGRLKYDIVHHNIDTLNFKYIIFTGQGAFFEQIIAFFKSSDALLTSKNIKMFYKAHPRELKNETNTFKEKIKMLKCCSFYEGEHTTEELIKNSLAHISVFSSCHFDAIYFKEKTYILDVMDNNIMNYYAQIAPQNFVKIKNIEEILENV